MVSPEQLAFVAGVAVSLAAFYLPFVGPRYQKLDEQGKSQVMGLAIVLVGAGCFLLGFWCVGPFCLPRPLDLPNELFRMALSIVAALVSNQGTFTLFHKMRRPTEAPALT